MRDIALIGRARSGKDTVGARLVSRYGYMRLAFADPLKRMALEIDPIITHAAGEPMRLSALVGRHGWDVAKTTFPEVRRFLQHVGQSIRDRTPNYWIDRLIADLDSAPGPVVVTDVRYMNEAKALERMGFRLVRIIRPGVEKMTHASETELEDIVSPITIMNSGTLADLHAHADSIAR
ncbi:deoxynucleotide monophosphate kinase family protein [Kitasatospora sp. NPDC001132]